jgi:hypothetical protein
VNIKFQSSVSPRVSVALRSSDSQRIDRLPVKVPTLTELLVELSPLPAASVLLGTCDDRLPVLLDLTNPEPGAVLMIGGSESGKEKLINAIINSACAISPPRKLRVCCFANSDAHDYLTVYPHCYRVVSTKGNAAQTLLNEMVYTAEQRLYRGDTSSAIILIVDDLGDLCQKLDAEGLNQLLWLVQNGAQAQIWTFAAYDPGQSVQVGSAVLNSFPTWLLGYSNPVQSKTSLSEEICQTAERLLPGCQFAAYFENEWVPFWIPAT